jgi:hypothetical protein
MAISIDRVGRRRAGYATHSPPDMLGSEMKMKGGLW